MKKTKKALASLAIAGMALTMIPFNAFAADTVSLRLAGNTAVQTAQAIAQDGWTTSQYAVIAPASAYNMVDALAAAPLAATLKAPVLLTGGDQLSAEVKEEITRLGVKTVYATSGLAVIKAGVIADLQGMGVEVVNLGGFDQYETSVNIAKQIAKVTPTTTIFIANGEAARVAQDALSVAAIAGAQQQPLLLTQKGQLPAAVADYIASIKDSVTASYITGGTGVVSDAVKAQLPGTVYRNAGNDAYDTNLEVLKNFTDLDFGRTFVANGETMIDALAGAPLAAATKSPVVLVNGSVKTATTNFLKTKVTASTVVTALGGTAVVPEYVRTAIAQPDELNVTDVAGTTSSIYEGDDDPVLAFTVGGVAKTIDEMEDAGYTVEFQATQPVFYGDEYDSTDGILNMGDDAEFPLTVDETFNYKVVISKGDTVITSTSKKVTVKEATSGTSAIDEAKIFLANEDGDIDGDNVEIKSGTLTVDDEAFLRVRGSDADDEYGPITTEAKYSSSDPAIAYIDKSDDVVQTAASGDVDDEYAQIVLGGSTGSVTITITTSDGYKKTLDLKVVDEDRKVSSSKTDIDKPSKLKLGGPDTSQVFGVTVNDQFGDPIKDYVIEPKDAISGGDTIAQAVAVEYVGDDTAPDYDGDVDDDNAATDKKGRVVVLVKGGEDDGTASFTIKDEESDSLGSVSVSNRASSGTATDYDLTIAPFKSKTLDASDDDDKTAYFIIDAYDSSGYRTDDVDYSDLTLKIDGDKVTDDDDDPSKYVTATIDDAGYITVTAKKVKSGSIKIALYQGDSSINLASTTVEVEDSNSTITGATFQSSIPTIYSENGIKLDRIIKDSGIKTDDGNPVTFELEGDYEVRILAVDRTVIGNLKLSVLDGDLYPTFEDNDDDIYVVLHDSDEGETGKIRLTVNKLTGGDVNEDGAPDNATSITSTNITVDDLSLD